MAKELDSQPNGSQSGCPYSGVVYLRHITEEELVLRILGGSAMRFANALEFKGQGFPDYWQQVDAPDGGVYLCTCGGDYQYHE